ncbi:MULTISPECIES: hypothetical protein [Campylobacter]|uniref:hypothetical protein n=1 Tax=Campylobacter TaxID=194 RepID=UPI000A34AAC0|nr:hypothetical protein [Campylobacter sp. P0024]MCR8679620.1 hypothetical protein [Campylobacter sp. RM19072]
MAKVKNTYLKGYKTLTQFNTPFRQTWEIIKWRNIAMVKLVELLHIQLMRKGKHRDYGSYYHPVYGYVYSISKYDIKSGSSAPYDYHSPYNLGLNQFFVGQNPYAWYQGDPGDSSGIYHDTCEIVRSVDNATSTKYGYKDLSLIKKWGQGEMVHSLHPVFNPFKDREYIYRFPVKAKISCRFEWDNIVYKKKNFKEILDENGNKIIDKSQSTIKVIRNVSIDMERWRINLDGSRQRLADIRDLNFNTTLQATPIYKYTYWSDGSIRDEMLTGYNKDINIFANLPEFYRELKDSRVYTYDEMTKLLGQTLEVELVLNGDDDFVDIYLWGSYAGRIIAFGDGEVAGYMDDGRILIQGTKRGQHSFTTGSDNEHTHYFYYDIPTLNLIETFDPNTHMPLRGAFKFVTEWQSHYGLFVEEDKETWEKLVPIVAIVIVIVVTIVTWGTMTAQTASAGSAVTAGTTGATGAGAAAGATSAGFYSASASALASIGITTAAGTLALSSIFLSALGYGLSYAGAKHGIEGLITGGKIASFAGAAMGVASIGASISTALSTATSQAVASQSGCYLTQMALNGGGATSGVGATSMMVNSGMSITTNLGVTTVNSGMGIVSVGTANSSVLFVNGVAMSGTGIIGSMAAQFGFSMTTVTQLLSLSNIATTTYSIGNSLYGGFNSVKDVLSSLRGEPVDPQIPTNQSDEEALANGNGAIGVSSSVVMRFERDIMPADLGLDEDSLIYVRSLLKAYIHDKGNLANLVDNIIQTRLKKRYAPLVPAME